MLKCLLVVGVVLPLFLLSCGTGEVPLAEPAIELAQPSQPISISPFPPQAGEQYTLTYNPSHPDALLGNTDSLVVDVSVARMNATQTFTYPLTYRNGSFSAHCTLPVDAIGIDVVVRPVLQYRNQESAKFPVFYRQRPQLGALPFVMNNSPSALELFELDHRIYPAYLWRYYPYWKRQIQQHRDPSVITPTLDSLHTLWQSTTNTLDPLSTLAVCVFGNIAAGRYSIARTLIQPLNQALVRQSTVTIPTVLLASMLGEAVAVLRLRSSQSNDTLYHLATEIKTVLVKLLPTSGPILVRLVGQHKTMSLRSRTKHISITEEQENQLWQHFDSTTAIEIVNWYAQERDQSALASVGTNILPIFMSLHAQSKQDRELQTRIIQAIRRFRDIAQQSSQPLVSCNTPIIQYLSDGVRISADFLLGDMLIAQAPEEGKALLHQLLAQYRRNYMTSGALSATCTTLFKYWLTRLNLDSATYYWALASKLGSPFASALWDSLRRAGYRYSQETLLSKVSLPVHLTEPTYTIIPIKTDNGWFDPRQSIHPTLLLFASQSCGLCRTYYPKLIQRIEQEKLRVTTIVVTVESGYRLFLSPKLEALVRYANADPPFLMNYRVEGFPTVVIINRDKVIHHGGLSSDVAISHLIEILRNAQQQ